jgi:hypothetical protein
MRGLAALACVPPGPTDRLVTIVAAISSRHIVMVETPVIAS